MDLSILNQWLGALALVIGVVNAIGLWIVTPGKKLAADLGKLEASCLESGKVHDRRIQSLEDAARHLPTVHDIHDLGKQIAVLDARVKLLAATVTRIDDHMREAG